MLKVLPDDLVDAFCAGCGRFMCLTYIDTLRPCKVADPESDIARMVMYQVPARWVKQRRAVFEPVMSLRIPGNA